MGFYHFDITRFSRFIPAKSELQVFSNLAVVFKSPEPKRQNWGAQIDSYWLGCPNYTSEDCPKGHLSSLSDHSSGKGSSTASQADLHSIVQSAG